jgi:magnesium chelatase family protein
LRALARDARDLLFQAIDQLGLSLRAYNKVLRVSRTIADLEGSDAVRTRHVAEAIQYRTLDREPGKRFELPAVAADSGSH